MKCFYRISDGSSIKERLPFATKEYCLDNFLRTFGKHAVHIVADNVTEERWESLQRVHGPVLERTQRGSSAQSFRHVLAKALELPADDIVYFVEDDYLHLPGSDSVLVEGIERADYVSLYDHPDKYLDAGRGGNPLVTNGGEVTRVITTPSSHWKVTNSTTMTFATRVKTLREDASIWKRHTEGTYPHDFRSFLELRERGRTLITPMPSYATHTEIAWLAPFVNWRTLERRD